MKRHIPQNDHGRRIDSLQSDVSEQGRQIALLTQGQLQMQASINDLSGSIKEMVKGSRPNYQTWIMGITAMFAIMGFFWMVLTLKMNVEVQPMGNTIARHDQTISLLASDATSQREKMVTLTAEVEGSISDRNALHQQANLLQNALSDVQSRQAADHSERLANEREIETQFNANSQIQNEQWSEGQREMSVVWEHIPSLGKYPSQPFYFPNISQQGQNKQQ